MGQGDSYVAAEVGFLLFNFESNSFKFKLDRLRPLPRFSTQTHCYCIVVCSSWSWPTSSHLKKKEIRPSRRGRGAAGRLTFSQSSYVPWNCTLLWHQRDHLLMDKGGNWFWSSPCFFFFSDQKNVVPIGSSHSQTLSLDMACFGLICLWSANLYYFGDISAYGYQVPLRGSKREL